MQKNQHVTFEILNACKWHFMTSTSTLCMCRKRCAPTRWWWWCLWWKRWKNADMCIPNSFHTVFMSNEYKRFMGCQMFSNQIDHLSLLSVWDVKELNHCKRKIQRKNITRKDEHTLTHTPDILANWRWTFEFVRSLLLSSLYQVYYCFVLFCCVVLPWLCCSI